MPAWLAETGSGRGEGRSRGLAAMLTFLTVGLVITALYFGREVLVPFALAVLLSFLLAPAVPLLRRLRAGRVTAVGAVVLVAFVAIVGFGAIVAAEISRTATRSRIEKCMPTPNISSMTPISASCGARWVSAT